MRLEMVSSAAGPTLTQPISYQFQPISTACFQQTATKTSFASKVFGKGESHPIHWFSKWLHKPSFKLAIENASISGPRRKDPTYLAP